MAQRPGRSADETLLLAPRTRSAQRYLSSNPTAPRYRGPDLREDSRERCLRAAATANYVLQVKRSAPSKSVSREPGAPVPFSGDAQLGYPIAAS